MTTNINIKGKVVSSTGKKLITEKGSTIYYFIVVAENFTLEKEYFEVETWNRLVEICKIECKKDTLIKIEGRLKKGIKTTKDSHIGVKIIAEKIEFLEVFREPSKEILLLRDVMDKAGIPFKWSTKSHWGYPMFSLSYQVGKDVCSVFQVERTNSEGLLEVVESVETEDTDVRIKVEFLSVDKAFEKLKNWKN